MIAFKKPKTTERPLLSLERGLLWSFFPYNFPKPIRPTYTYPNLPRTTQNINTVHSKFKRLLKIVKNTITKSALYVSMQMR